MSDLILRDGAGTGARAGVTSDNRLRTEAVTESRLAHWTFEEQLAFAATVSEMTIPSTSEHAIFWIKNTDSERTLRVYRMGVSWNGGGTTWYKTLNLKTKVAMSTPAGAYTSLTPANLTLGSSRQANVDCRVWDKTGTGMTFGGGSIGVTALQSYVAKGLLLIPFEGALDLLYGQSLGVTYQGEEQGFASFVFLFWMQDNL